jgi:hypothetical protein
MLTLQDSQVQLRIAHLSLVMMEENVPEEEYRLLSEHLVNASMGLLRAGQFSFLTGILESLRAHARDKKSEAIRQRALWAVQAFSSRQTMPLVAPYLQEGAGEPEAVALFLRACGEEILPWLFDLYLDPSFTPSPHLLDIMGGFGQKAGEEAYRRLRGQNTQGVTRLLAFIREKAHYNVASELADLYHQGNRDVKREVLETLLLFEDPLAVKLLHEGVRTENWEERMEAVVIICRHRIWDLLDEVLAHVKTFVIGKEDVLHNERIIREIAASGDPVVKPHLERLTRVHWTLSPRRLSGMKRLLREVLPAA